MNIYTKIGIITIALFFVFHTTFAASLSSSMFGGKIIATKAKMISSLELAGYKCDDVKGESIEILSFRGPTSYFIPTNVKSKTNTTPSAGQYILGKYSGTTTITCKRESGETGGSWFSSGISIFSAIPVTLPNVTLFGTSKR